MKSRCLTLPLILIFLTVSCTDKKPSTAASGEEGVQPSQLYFSPGSFNHTPSSGTPIPAQSHWIDPDEVASPEVVPLQRRPRAIPANLNVYPANAPERVPVPASDALKILTPGRAGVSAPTIYRAQEKIVALKQPVPIPALPPRIKDAATYDIQYLDVDQGLISSYIRSLLEDRHGNLWFGSSYGVSRYDGKNFFQYTAEHGLAKDAVLSMYEDRYGQIWFGTDGGVSRYDGNRFVNYTANEGFTNGAVRAILEDKRGDLWFGTNEGVIHFDGASFSHYTTEQGLISNDVLSMSEDSQGNLWFGTSQGLACYQPDQEYKLGRFIHYTKAEGLISNLVHCILKDSHGGLWFGTNKGITYYNPLEDRGRFLHYTEEMGFSNQSIKSILEDKQGHLWFCSGNGAIRFDGTNFIRYTADEGLSNNRLRCILEDSDGNLWFGTGGGGVNRFKKASFVHYMPGKGLGVKGIVSIVEDSDGNLWFGTSQGASRYDGSTYTYYTHEEGLISDDIYCILEDSRGNMWFGTDAGVSRFDGINFTNYTTGEGLIDNKIFCMLEDRRGNIWFGTKAGICRYDGTSFTNFSTEQGSTSEEISSIEEDGAGDLWFGTSLGVSRYNGTSFMHYTTRDGLIDNQILCLLKDSQGKLWLGTRAGLSRYTPTDQGGYFTNYTTAEGLSNKVVWSMQEDIQQNIWISTEKGITLLQPRVKSSDPNILPDYQFFTFGKSDGLQRLDFQVNSVCLDRRNRIWWGTEGVSMLDLNQFKPATEPPKSLSLVQVEVNQHFIDYRRLNSQLEQDEFSVGEQLLESFDSIVAFYNYPASLTLPYHLNHLTFHFSAIDWARPHKISYRYKLKGLDKTWSSPSPEAKANYRNLSPGNYTLAIMAMGEAKIWSDPLAYSFFIRPPWWHTSWAYLGYVLIVALIGRVSYPSFKKWLLLQEELKRKEEESLRLRDLNSFKSRLYTNLTHEFRNPLTVILGMVDQIKSNPERFLADGTSLIRRNGQEMLRLVRQLLDLSKLENKSFRLKLQRGNIVPYLGYLTDAFHPYAEAKGIALNFSAAEESIVLDYDQEQIKQIITNLISNALKFTQAGGSISVRAAQDEGHLKIEVADTGIGIAPAHLPYIFDRFYQVDDSTTRKQGGTGVGLSLTKELIILIGGQITVESELGKGSVFKIELPIQIAETTPEEIPDEDDLSVGAYLPLNYALDNGKKSALGGVGDVTRLQLLIIEDNRDVVTYLESCLAGSYQLGIAFDGKAGIEKAIETIPDLIITDLMMPKKDGFEVCDTLKTDERTSHIPIIILTAKVEAEAKISGLKKGADAYLEKPFDKYELLVRVEMMIKKQKKLAAYFSRKFQYGFVALRTDSDEKAEEGISKEVSFVERIREIVENNYSDPDFSLPILCEKINMSRSQLFRKMKALISTSPSSFIRNYRLEKAKILLETSDITVAEVCYKTGYKDPAHFSRSFVDEFGYLPSEAGK